MGRILIMALMTVTIAALTAVIWRQHPTVDGTGHFSHRLALSPDGQYLFITSGERQKMQPAQDPGSDLGKIIRMNPDGTDAQHWTLGHRNPLGIAFDAAGNLWSSEMGPQGGDELNLIQPGLNYGWPNASNGIHYNGKDIPDHAEGDGYEPPKVYWDPSISPGSLMIYSGDLFPNWQGDAFLGDQFKFFAQGREARRRGLRGEEFTRVRLESQHGGLQSAAGGMRDDATEQGAMAEVHTVEIADGEHGRSGRRSL